MAFLAAVAAVGCTGSPSDTEPVPPAVATVDKVNVGGYPGQFDGVHQIHVDQEGNLHVTEVANDRSQKFRPKSDADLATLVGPPVGGWSPQ